MDSGGQGATAGPQSIYVLLISFPFNLYSSKREVSKQSNPILFYVFR
jgi:hypothetical protein